jgi:hypothetical protein
VSLPESASRLITFSCAFCTAGRLLSSWQMLLPTILSSWSQIQCSWSTYELLPRDMQDVCIKGRDKSTRLRSFPAAAFQCLAVTCDRRHEHAPGGRISGAPGKFRTSEESAFPDLLCLRLPHVCKPSLPLRAQSASGVSPSEDSTSTDIPVARPVPDPRQQDAKVAALVLPRGELYIVVVPDSRAVARLPVKS